MQVRDVIVAMGGSRCIRRAKVGEVVEVSPGVAIFVPSMLPDGEMDPEQRDIELRQFYTEVRPHLDAVVFDAPPPASQHVVQYGRARDYPMPSGSWACPARLRGALFPDD